MEPALNEADRSIDGLAHDLRNLLLCVRGYSEVLLKPDLPLIRRQAHCMRLTALIDRCVLLIDSLQGLPGELCGVSVAQDVAEFAARAHEPLYHRKGVALQRVAVGGPTFVSVEPQALLRILHNLLSNALRLTPSGGAVTLEVEPAPGECRIAVRDTGIGMTVDQLERIFEPFYQAMPSEPHSRGLGLTIARDIARRVGGCLRAESAGLGSGSTMRVTLPLYVRPSNLRGAGAAEQKEEAQTQ